MEYHAYHERPGLVGCGSGRTTAKQLGDKPDTTRSTNLPPLPRRHPRGATRQGERRACPPLAPGTCARFARTERTARLASARRESNSAGALFAHAGQEYPPFGGSGGGGGRSSAVIPVPAASAKAGDLGRETQFNWPFPHPRPCRRQAWLFEVGRPGTGSVSSF